MDILREFPDIDESVLELALAVKNLTDSLKGDKLYHVAAHAHIIRLQARKLEHLVSSKIETEPKLKP